MATTGDIISRALRLIGVGSPGQALSGADADTGLEALNALVDSLGLFRNLVPSLTEETFNLTGAANYTIGSGQTFDTVMPIRVDNSTFVRVNGVDCELDVINGEQWAEIPVKDLSLTIPEALYFYRGQQTGEIRFDAQVAAGAVLHLRSWKTLTTYTDSATDLGLPAGYERMLAYNLAVEIAPEYGKEAPPTVQRIANVTRHAISAAQAEIPKLKVPAPVRSNILVDG